MSAFEIYSILGVVWGFFFTWAVLKPQDESVLDQTLSDLCCLLALFILIAASWPLWGLSYYYEWVVRPRFGSKSLFGSTRDTEK
jgi:hypothetical protein